MKEDLIKETVEHLINYQLRPHNITVDDVREIEDWYMKYTQTKQEQEAFYEYATNYISSKLKMSKKRARKEADWFVLQWGLKLELEEKVKIK
jgi:hypothetical protein